MNDFNVLIEAYDGPMLVNKNDCYVGRLLREVGEFSPGERKLFERLIGKGMVVVEVGAQMGAHTRTFGRLVGEGGWVIAFEPQRFMFNLLCANVALANSLNIQVLPYGVGNEAGRLRLPILDPRVEQNFGGVGRETLSDGSYEEVTQVTLDAMDFGKVDFLKIDCEGMETEVLEGARNLVAKFRPLLYVEDDRKAKSPRLRELIAELGYTIFQHEPHLADVNCDQVHPLGQFKSLNLLCIPKEQSTLQESVMTDRVEELTAAETELASWAAAERQKHINEAEMAMQQRLGSIVLSHAGNVKAKNEFFEKDKKLFVRLPVEDLALVGGASQPSA